MFIIQRQHLDDDDYPIGSPYDKIGPFDTRDDAWGWAIENHYCGYKYAYGVIVIDLMWGVKAPEEWHG